MCLFLVSNIGNIDENGLYLVNYMNSFFIIDYFKTVGFPTYIVKKNDYFYVSFENNNENIGAGIGSYTIIDNKIIEVSFYDSYGRSYCHLCVDDNEDYLFCANYHVGATAMYSIISHKVVEKLGSFHHNGSGPDILKRQVGPHAHYVGFLPYNNYLYSVDLGCDKVYVFDYSNNHLNEVSSLHHNVLPGYGPRHMVFLDNNLYAYALCEFTNKILVYKYVKEHFSLIQSIHCVPRHFTGFSSASAIHFSDSFNYLFVANRGHDSIAFYRVNHDNGKLTLLYMVHTDKCPIDFNFIDNHHIVVACQKTGKLQLLSFDEENELLEVENDELQLNKPTCILSIKK